MEQLMVMVLQTCSEYAQKSAVRKLTEYEMLMYEQLCRTVTVFMRCHENAIRIETNKQEAELKEEEEEEDGDAVGSAA